MNVIYSLANKIASMRMAAHSARPMIHSSRLRQFDLRRLSFVTYNFSPLKIANICKIWIWSLWTKKGRKKRRTKILVNLIDFWSYFCNCIYITINKWIATDHMLKIWKNSNKILKKSIRVTHFPKRSDKNVCKRFQIKNNSINKMILHVVRFCMSGRLFFSKSFGLVSKKRHEFENGRNHRYCP